MCGCVVWVEWWDFKLKAMPILKFRLMNDECSNWDSRMLPYKPVHATYHWSTLVSEVAIGPEFSL